MYLFQLQYSLEEKVTILQVHAEIKPDYSKLVLTATL